VICLSLLDVICLSLLDVICSSILLVCMIRLIPAIIIMLYYCLFRIKSYGKLLIYSTALIKNGTWHLIPSAHGQNVIDCKWVYKVK
jgi:hypothetical protein